MNISIIHQTVWVVATGPWKVLTATTNTIKSVFEKEKQIDTESDLVVINNINSPEQNKYSEE